MGACEFFCRGIGTNANDAFCQAIRDAQYENGHGGYTGTIAEKSSFKLLTPPKGMKVQEFVDRVMNPDDELFDREVDDKWGPAGCVALGAPKGAPDDTTGVYLFFGWASE